MSDVTELEQVFSDLGRQGIIAKPNYMCCGGCAVAGIASEHGEDARFAYWHQQDDERAFPWKDDTYDCDDCRGDGGNTCEECGGDGTDEDGEECFGCDGTGTIDCWTCGGDGTITEDATERTGDDLTGSLFIGYGGPTEQDAKQVGEAIQTALEDAGYEVNWSGDTDKRIEVVA